MNDTKRFFDEEIVLRWPDWEPTGPQIEDWENLIRPYRREDVLDAITKLAYEKDWKSPSLPTMKRNLKAYRFAKPSFTRPLFVQSDTGEFQKIFIQADQDITDDFLMEMGMNWARRFEARRGGKWIAYTGVTDEEMCEKRWAIRSAK